jgi:NAD(P)-dependent dehydrogenase (short-subunit alcohol dehydrogenase family)
MDLELHGKRALVTGSSAGIGRAIALRLASEGVRIVVHGRNEERSEAVAAAIRDAGGQAIATIGDLALDDAAAAVAHAATNAFGGIDILVNNAGGRELATWEHHTPARWLARINENMVGALRLSFLLIPEMQQRKWGRLIQIGSIAGAMPHADYGDYSASKAALISMTTSIAQKFAIDGITSNILSVGMVFSESSQILARTMNELHLSAEDAERHICTKILPVPAGRFCRLEEVADCVSFLASPKAGYVNGANLRLDGGRNPTISL